MGRGTQKLKDEWRLGPRLLSEDGEEEEAEATRRQTAGWALGVAAPHPTSLSAEAPQRDRWLGWGEGQGAADPHLFQRPCRSFLGLRLLFATGLQDGHDGVGDVCLLGEEQDAGATERSNPEPLLDSPDPWLVPDPPEPLTLWHPAGLPSGPPPAPRAGPMGPTTPHLGIPDGG